MYSLWLDQYVILFMSNVKDAIKYAHEQVMALSWTNSSLAAVEDFYTQEILFSVFFHMHWEFFPTWEFGIGEQRLQWPSHNFSF